MKFDLPANPFSPTVAILGAGPAGLIAAHAAVQEGCRVCIFDRKKPDIRPFAGAQFLHEPILGLPVPTEFTIDISGIGTPAGYANKVYGDPAAPSSYDEYTNRQVRAWSMKQTYRDLCDRYGWMVTTVDIDSTLFASILFSFDLVVCSIPRPLICMNHEHVFRDAPIMIVPVGHVAGDNVIVYNGDPTVSWCRTSMIQGLGYTEYPAGKYDGSYGRSIFYRKPRDHNCICWRNQDNLVMVGRQGVWDKRVLVHHSYDVTIMWLDKVREKLNHAV